MRGFSSAECCKVVTQGLLVVFEQMVGEVSGCEVRRIRDAPRAGLQSQIFLPAGSNREPLRQKITT